MIITADWHLRSSVPRCRMETEEEWFETQKRTLEFIYSFNESVYIAGDIFHHYNPSNRILDLFLSFALHNETHIMMGNHDARTGVFDPDSGYGVLQRIVDAGHPYLRNMEPYCWQNYGEEKMHGDGEALFLHTLCFPSNSDAPIGANYVTARTLIEQHPIFDCIIVGDNHTHFKKEIKDSIVISPGCITKQAVDYKDKKLKMFRLPEGSIIKDWDKLEAIDLPDDSELVDDAYIVSEHERNDRYNTLVESLKMNEEMSFDYKSNVWLEAANNTVSEGCKGIVMEVLPQC
jgi:DNA repair exonuclease SbcCD nuclease subunit